VPRGRNSRAPRIIAGIESGVMIPTFLSFFSFHLLPLFPLFFFPLLVRNADVGWIGMGCRTCFHCMMCCGLERGLVWRGGGSCWRQRWDQDIEEEDEEGWLLGCPRWNERVRDRQTGRLTKAERSCGTQLQPKRVSCTFVVQPDSAPARQTPLMQETAPQKQVKIKKSLQK
jgi:hypothetical protein